MNTKKYIVIGSSAAGIGAIQKIRSLDPFGSVLCVTEEEFYPYNKCFLIDYVNQDKTYQELFFKSEIWFKDKNIDYLKAKVTEVNTCEKYILTSDNRMLWYEKLLLTIGSKPKMLPWQKTIKGVFTFHTLKDMNSIEEWILSNAVKKVLIVGSGLTGIEMADALIKKKIHVTCIEKEDRLLKKQVNENSSQAIQSLMSMHGVLFFFNTEILFIESLSLATKTMIQVHLSCQQILEVDMIILAAGSYVEILQHLPHPLDQRIGGILVNEYCQTSEKDIFAAGDCAAFFNISYQEYRRSFLWKDALLQGGIAGTNMVCYATKKYTPEACFITSYFFGIYFYLLGENNNHAAHTYYEDSFYEAVFMHNNIVQGFILLSKTPHPFLLAYKKSFIQQVFLIL